VEYTLSINKETLKIALPTADEALIGEKRYVFNGRLVSGNELLLTLDGRQFPAYLVDVGGETQLFLNGRTYFVEDLGDADRRPKRRGGPGDLELSFPR